MLDYGTGSGVLAVAALKMGAGRALGIDCEVESTELCGVTADLNGLTDRFEVSLCSADVRQVQPQTGRPPLENTHRSLHLADSGASSDE